MDFKSSETFQNLKKAYSGELEASTKYRIYGAKAGQDGYQQISEIFNETSKNEQEHAKIWLKLLNGFQLPGTQENLKDAIAGEDYEWKTMYQNFAKIAEKEGFFDIAKLFWGVANVEHHHDYRFQALYKNIAENNVFCKPTEYVWICTNCGHLHSGFCAPDKCPVCGHPKDFFKLNCENY